MLGHGWVWVRILDVVSGVGHCRGRGARRNVLAKVGPAVSVSSYSATDSHAVVAQEKQTRDKVAHHLALALEALGLDTQGDKELDGTPERVAHLWSQILCGAQEGPPELNVLSSSGDQEDMVLVRDLAFRSVCAHHLTPFFGKASIAYIPGESLIGVGVPPRVLQYFARRPQIQERLGEQVATYLTRTIDPRGVMVHLVGRHLCMELRGARTEGTVETTATRGWFSDKEWRTEFFERLMARR